MCFFFFFFFFLVFFFCFCFVFLCKHTLKGGGHAKKFFFSFYFKNMYWLISLLKKIFSDFSDSSYLQKIIILFCVFILFCFFLTLGLAALVNLFFSFHFISFPSWYSSHGYPDGRLVTQMVGWCVAASCSNTTKDGVSLYQFPGDPILRKQWTYQVQPTRSQ